MGVLVKTLDLLNETIIAPKEKAEPVEPKCGICGVECVASCLCFGCNNYVCDECDWATGWLWRRPHKIEEHLFLDEEDHDQYYAGGGH